MRVAFGRWVVGLAVAVTLAGGVRADGQGEPVRIQVDAGASLGTYKPDWNFFGADEPNYTYAPNGTKLLRELSAIDPATPVYFRPHNLLTSGDGSASLKWGSTGVYAETPEGKPVTVTIPVGGATGTGDMPFDPAAETWALLAITTVKTVGWPAALSTSPFWSLIDAYNKMSGESFTTVKAMGEAVDAL